MTPNPQRYVGPSDCHDGSILAVSRTETAIEVRIQGASGKHYTIWFYGVSRVESESPEGMIVYALAETETDAESLRQYEFLNWYADEPRRRESQSYLRIVAGSFSVEDCR